MDDDPGPLATLDAPIYPTPGPAGQLVAGASGALSGWENGTQPIHDKGVSLSGQAGALGTSIGGLGGELEPGITFWHGQNPGAAVDELSGVLALPSPNVTLGADLPLPKTPDTGPPPTDQFVSQTNGIMDNLDQNLQNYVVQDQLPPIG